MAPTRDRDIHRVIRRKRAFIGSLRRDFRRVESGWRSGVTQPVLATAGALNRIASQRRLKSRLHPLHFTERAAKKPFKAYTPYRPPNHDWKYPLHAVAENYSSLPTRQADTGQESPRRQPLALLELDEAAFEPLDINLDTIRGERHDFETGTEGMRSRINAVSLHLGGSNLKPLSGVTPQPTLDQALQEAFEAVDRFNGTVARTHNN